MKFTNRSHSLTDILMTDVHCTLYNLWTKSPKHTSRQARTTCSGDFSTQ